MLTLFKLFGVSLVWFSLFFLAQVCAAQRIIQEGVYPLELKGRVVELRRASDDNPRYIDIEATIEFDFKNVSKTPLIIYSKKPWLGGVFVAQTFDDSRSRKYLINRSAWPAFWGPKRHREFYNEMNQQAPPPELTTILRPNETWPYRIIVTLGICRKISRPGCDDSILGEQVGASTVFLQAMFEMWPVNVEPELNPDDPKFGRKLRDRWKTYGDLWLDYLTSQPVQVDLGKVSE